MMNDMFSVALACQAAARMAHVRAAASMADGFFEYAVGQQSEARRYAAAAADVMAGRRDPADVLDREIPPRGPSL